MSLEIFSKFLGHEKISKRFFVHKKSFAFLSVLKTIGGVFNGFKI